MDKNGFKKSNVVIHIKERNVDGCGGDADVLIAIRKDIVEDDCQYLSDALSAIKARSAINGECLDTDDIVSEACNWTFGQNNWGWCQSMFIEF